MSSKLDILNAYYTSINERVEEVKSVKIKDLVEDNNGNRYIVEQISTDYNDVKEFDKLGQGEIWIKYNKHLAENQTWLVIKDDKGKKTVTRYGDDGVRLIIEKQLDHKPEHVKVDKSIINAYQEVINESIKK